MRDFRLKLSNIKIGTQIPIPIHSDDFKRLKLGTALKRGLLIYFTQRVLCSNNRHSLSLLKMQNHFNILMTQKIFQGRNHQLCLDQHFPNYSVLDTVSIFVGNIYGNPDCFILKDRQSRGPGLEFSYSRGASEDVEFSVPGFFF